ncbi:MAG: glycolate oxidase subunit GlcE, partial [Dokdonella sp.]
TFGGQVMKNVAGFDVSRLLAGSLGALGVLLEVSLKVQPKPAAVCTLAFDLDEADALRHMADWRARPLPVSATSWHDGRLHVRLAGANAAVREARIKLGGDDVDGEPFWQALREQRDEFFNTHELWRLSLPPSAPAVALGRQWIEWGGAQRWLHGTASADEIRHTATALGGHATRFRGGARAGVFTPLSAPVMVIHRRLKAVFDPAGIFNRGRLYAELD